jgi:hypothetical protein
MQIENLSKDLDAKTLSETRGGDNGNSAVNTVGQVLNLSAPVATLSGGPANTFVDIYNEQFGGDVFKVAFPYSREA